jgi:hypothetical protein
MYDGCMNFFATFLDLSAPDFILFVIFIAVITAVALGGRAVYKGFLKGYFGSKNSNRTEK